MSTPDISFIVDVTRRGVDLQFGSITNISVEVPSAYSCHIEMLLDWFEFEDDEY